MMTSVNVVFHIDEQEKWSLLLANVRNLIKAVDIASSNIVILANANAVSVFAQEAASEHIEAMKALSKNGAQCSVCQNSLNGLRIEVATLPEFVAVVPVGVLTLIEKQAAGFAYIKP